MYLKPLSILFCVSSISLFVNAANDHHVTASSSQRYIVQLKPSTDIDSFVPNLLKGIFDLIGDIFDGMDDDDKSKALAKRANPVQVFDSFDIDGSFKAISTKIKNNSLLDSMLGHFGEIVDIFPDDVIKFDLPKPQTIRRRYYTRHLDNAYTKRHLVKNEGTAANAIEQANAEWNLVRMSQRKADPKAPYLYPESAGEGVRVYVMDDGVNKDHSDFGGRVTWGFSTVGNDTSTQIGGGHGTHVSGIIAGEVYGIAKKANIVSVQVLNKNGEGTVSDLLAGVQWITNDFKKNGKKAIVNMSLGMPASAPGGDAMNKALTAAAKGGLAIFVAAGNSGSDACDIVPAGNPDVYTVGASDKTDTLDYRSCYGKCVAITAPGIDIKSVYIGGKNATATMSGTSMAAPHVAGIAALILQDMADSTPKALFDAVTALGTKDVIKENRPETPNLLAFNGIEESGSFVTSTK